MKGKLIAIEGIDGAGGETQSKLLVRYLKNRGIKAVRIAYPDYNGPIGKLIHKFLHKKFDLPKQLQFMLYATDMMKDILKIQSMLSSGKWVIADRWFASTLAYQCGKEITVKNGVNFAKFFGIRQPDINIYLKVSPIVSIKRKLKEKGSLDRNEANKALLEKISKNYSTLIKHKIFGKWVVIDGEQTIQKVFEEIKKALKI